MVDREVNETQVDATVLQLAARVAALLTTEDKITVAERHDVGDLFYVSQVEIKYALPGPNGVEQVVGYLRPDEHERGTWELWVTTG